jgi:hypothetical protein
LKHDAVWKFFRLPVPKGRTYAELDALFERSIPVGKFKDSNVDIFNVEAEIIRRRSVVPEKLQPTMSEVENLK